MVEEGLVFCKQNSTCWMVEQSQHSSVLLSWSIIDLCIFRLVLDFSVLYHPEGRPFDLPLLLLCLVLLLVLVLGIAFDWSGRGRRHGCLTYAFVGGRRSGPQDEGITVVEVNFVAKDWEESKSAILQASDDLTHRAKEL